MQRTRISVYRPPMGRERLRLVVPPTLTEVEARYMSTSPDNTKRELAIAFSLPKHSGIRPTAACGASEMDRVASAVPGLRNMQPAHSHIFAATFTYLCRLKLLPNSTYDYAAYTQPWRIPSLDV